MESVVGIKVKICGLSTQEAVDAAVKGGASHVGFVFARRPAADSLGVAEASALAMRVPSQVRKVGVFFEQDSVFFDTAIAQAGLHVLQLHATDPRQASYERTRTGRSVWGVVELRTARDLDAGAQWRGAADRILYDVQTAECSALAGIPSPRCDWTLLKGITHPLPWILGGQLDQSNVSEAIAITGATMIDVSSCVRNTPANKAPDKIAAFLDAVQAMSPTSRRNHRA